MGVQYYVQPMFVSCTYGTTGLQYTFRSPTLSTAYVSKIFLQNYRVTLHFWLSNLRCNLCLLVLPTGLLGYTTLIGALSYVQAMFVCSAYKINGYTKIMGALLYLLAMFVTSTYRITQLDYPYGCSSLSTAYDCKLFLLNNWFLLPL